MLLAIISHEGLPAKIKSSFINLMKELWDFTYKLVQLQQVDFYQVIL
jgi:hypothetical protein